jgi:hypothetical protein
MGGREPCGGARAAGAGRGLVAAAVTAALAAVIVFARPHGEDVHRSDGACETCHTADAATLHADPAAARTAVVPDLEARCMACHGDEGPSHKTGVEPTKPVPDALPLTEGKVTCATCHFMHGEGDRSDDFCRIDNRRGALCLSCHTLGELE